MIQHTSYIMIVPTMTYDELKKNFKMLQEIGGKANQYFSNKLNIYYGCEYENILKEKQLLLPRTSFYERDNYEYIDAKVKMYADFTDILKKKLICIRVMFCKKIGEIKNKSVVKEMVRQYEEINDKYIVKLYSYALEYIDKYCTIEGKELTDELNTCLQSIEKEILQLWRGEIEC